MRKFKSFVNEEMSVTLKQHGSTSYKVHAVGSKMKQHGGFKVGDTVQDHHIDDLHDSGIKVRYHKESVNNEAIERKADSKMIMVKDPNTGRTVLKKAPRKEIEIGKGKMEAVEAEAYYADKNKKTKETLKKHDKAMIKVARDSIKKYNDRQISKAVGEETVNEISDTTKLSYINKANKAITDREKLHLKIGAKVDKDKTLEKMRKGVRMAKSKLGEEGGKIPKYATHVGDTKHGHSVYADSETDRGDASNYHVKHPDGKVTRHEIEHEDSVPSHKELATKSHWHNAHDLHKSVHKIMRNDIKDGLGHYGESNEQYTDKEGQLGEEVMKMYELKISTMQKYKQAARSDVQDRENARHKGYPEKDIDKRQDKRYKGIDTANKRIAKKQVKMATGVAFDKRYKDGNYSGAYKTINKIKKGLADHPKVKDALRRANEEFNKGE